MNRHRGKNQREDESTRHGKIPQEYETRIPKATASYNDRVVPEQTLFTMRKEGKQRAGWVIRNYS